jgi:hypothetical protein
MKLGIMQPYFFPYIGYWQLIGAAERFVIYDDVNYIKGGWVNRNRILVNGAPSFFTAPLHQPSPYRKICETVLHPSRWRDKLVKTVENTYRRAPGFNEVFPVVEELIRNETDNLAAYLAHQLRTLAAFMGIRTEFVETSRCYGNAHLSGQARVLDICQREGATTYINAPGGRALYDAGAFRAAGTQLRFIVMRPVSYTQRCAEFVPGLSVLDALMELGPVGVRPYLEAYDLVEA